MTIQREAAPRVTWRSARDRTPRSIAAVPDGASAASGKTILAAVARGRKISLIRIDRSGVKAHCAKPATNVRAMPLSLCRKVLGQLRTHPSLQGFVQRDDGACGEASEFSEPAGQRTRRGCRVSAVAEWERTWACEATAFGVRPRPLTESRVLRWTVNRRSRRMSRPRGARVAALAAR